MGRLTRREADRLCVHLGNVVVYVTFAIKAAKAALGILDRVDAEQDHDGLTRDLRSVIEVSLRHLGDVWLGDYKKECAALFDEENKE